MIAVVARRVPTLLFGALAFAVASAGCQRAPSTPMLEAPVAPQVRPDERTSASPDGAVCNVEQTIDEEQPAAISLTAACGIDAARWFPLDSAPFARWDTVNGVVALQPAFTDGGRTYEMAFEARGPLGARAATGLLTITVRDTIAPPAVQFEPAVPVEGGVQERATFVSDAWLDGTEHIGRTHVGFVTIAEDVPPDGAPVFELVLHGFNGDARVAAAPGRVRVALYDPDNTYWWGYANGNETPDYTLRQALHLLDAAMARYPNADPARVFVHGSSMGGTGALVLGLTRPTRFAWVSSFIGQTIPRNHRPSRRQQLASVWGPLPEGVPVDGVPTSVWDTMDATWLLAASPGSRELPMFLKHSKDDPIIHFGAALQPSPLTGLSFYDALERFAVGYVAVWDEGGHGLADPTLGDGWWSRDEHPMHAPDTRFRADEAFIAFAAASHNDDPGTMRGNGRVPWSDNAGFAGDARTPGDSGWDGDPAGMRNRGLAWDASALVDTIDRFELPVRVRLDSGAPVTVRMTPRRLQRFLLAPGESVQWQFGDQSGIALANDAGELTLPPLVVGPEWTPLVLARMWRGAP